MNDRQWFHKKEVTEIINSVITSSKLPVKEINLLLTNFQERMDSISSNKRQPTPQEEYLTLENVKWALHIQ